MPRPRKLTHRSSPRPPAAGETMNGGVIVESNTSLPAPALKQELLTEHYAISAKRPSQKDKMNRQLKINTSLEGHQYPPSFGPGPLTHPVGPPPQYPPSFHPGPGYYPPQQHGYLSFPPPGHAPPGPMTAGPVAGPSRRHSQPFAHAMPPQMYPGPGHGHGPQFPPQWETSPNMPAAGAHKRKRSESSQQWDENRILHGAPHPHPHPHPHDADHHPPPPHSVVSTASQQLPTPPSSTMEALPPLPEDTPQRKKAVYVTTSQEEGRKLSLSGNSTGPENKEQTPTRGPPRMKSATTLAVSASGKAALGSSEVLQSELDMLERSNQGTPAGAPRTPDAKRPRTPTSASKVAMDTPGTKANKTTRRLSAFNIAARPSEPMYSIRLDMGQGQPCRVALRKDLALAFVGLDNATQVVEESRKEDEDGWVVVNGAPGSRPPARPNWPEEEGIWGVASGARGARQQREERQRTALLKRYLESSSDDEDENDGVGRFPSHRGKAAGKRSVGPSPGGGNVTSDAKAALISALNRARRPQPRYSAPPMFVPNGVVNCVCKNNDGGPSISCVSCKTWHHVACVGLEDPQLAQNWVCDPCVVQARRATLSSPTGRTPSAARFSERSQTAFRGGDMALALAPSPMFAGDPAPSTPMGMGTRAPYSPTRRSHRARVLSYGTDIWGGVDASPTTPVPPPRIPDNFSTPRPDEMFDVNSTPSRHLNTDPRMAGQFNSLFAVTPLMGRSRNVSGMHPQDTPGIVGRRNVSGSQHPFSDSGVVSRHEFLQGLTADRRVPATEIPPSPQRRTLPDPDSPSPFAPGPRKITHMRTGSRTIGLGTPMETRDE